MSKASLAALLLGLTACSTRAQDGRELPEGMVRIGDVAWHADYDAAREVAVREGKPLWVHFGENPG